jgi:hypothetical protein
MLSPDQNLEFLSNKIMQVKTGLCCIDDDSFVVRTHIVEVLYADNAGNLYFTVMKPLLSLTDKESFGITLTFYKKIFDYYVQLKAEAVIEKDDNENDTDNAYILIKAKITEAEFVEHKKPFSQHTMFDNVKDNFRKLSKALAFFFY